MFARKRRSQLREPSESLGWKSAKTFSWVSSVSLEAPAPEEGTAALHVLDVVGDHPVAAEHLVLGFAEVVADGPDRADLGEEARRQREVGRRAAERPLALAERRLDRVERDRSHDREGHAAGEASAKT
jgi:hypothetical protein